MKKVLLFLLMFNFLSTNINAQTVTNVAEAIQSYRQVKKGIDEKTDSKEIELMFLDAPGLSDNSYKFAGNLYDVQFDGSYLNFLDLEQINSLNFGLYTSYFREQPGVDMFDAHAQNYCSFYSDVESKAFPGCILKLNALGPKYSVGDLKIANLLQYNLIKDAPHKELVDNLIYNLVNPFPSEKPRELLDKHKNSLKENPKRKLDPQEQGKFTSYLVNAAIANVSQYSFSKLYANRLPYQVKLDKDDPNSKVIELDYSKNKLMDDEVKRRFKEDWIRNTAVASKEALLREMIHMLAYELYTMLDEYESAERQELLMAVSLGSKMRTETTTQALNNYGT